MKNKLWIAAIAAVVSFTACSDNSSSSNNPTDPATEPGNTENNKENETQSEQPCSFKASDNEWKFTLDEGWKIVNVYTWIDDTTVKEASYMGSYHNEDQDKVHSGVNREEYYEEILAICQSSLTSEE